MMTKAQYPNVPQLRQAYTKIRKVYRFLHQHPLHGKLGRATRNDLRLDGLSSPRTDRPFRFIAFLYRLMFGNVTDWQSSDWTFKILTNLTAQN